MTMTRSKNHSGDNWVEKIKKNDATRGVTKDNPLTPFDKGDLYNVLDFFIDSLGTKA